MVTGGLLGYSLMLTAARPLMPRLMRPGSLQRLERGFDRGGAWAIVLTRSLPYSVPEGMAFLAGLARMPLSTFATALTVGSVPVAIVFAAIGAGWADQPVMALAVSYVLPIVILPLVLHVLRRDAR
jgi:uncharacterized membrane protein YdjX (TVP38/TMEM64 family)